MELTALGLTGIFLLSFAGATLIPLPMIPVEALIAAGMLLDYHRAALFSVIVVSSTLGGYTTYMMGVTGNRIVSKFISKSRKDNIEKIKNQIEKWGFYFVFISSTAFFIPYDLVALQCGLIRLDNRKFFLATFLGKIVRTSIVMILIQTGLNIR